MRTVFFCFFLLSPWFIFSERNWSIYSSYIWWIHNPERVQTLGPTSSPYWRFCHHCANLQQKRRR